MDDERVTTYLDARRRWAEKKPHTEAQYFAWFLMLQAFNRLTDREQDRVRARFAGSEENPLPRGPGR